MKLVECVPNFSEGRNKEIIDAITGAIKKVKGVTLLDSDPGYETNRTVVTIIGDPESVLEGAFAAIKTAAQLIDMSKHSGAHARMGATDVCPLVPVSDMTMSEVVELAHRLGKRVGEELGIPVYLYEYAATRPERTNLAVIRAGEYEGLATKLQDPEWAPDYGEPDFNEKSGATVIGARDFLVAYNINLNATHKKPANEIALNIREKGRFARDENGKFVRDENGKKVRRPGTLMSVKGTGWVIPEYGCAQISMNLTNINITPVHLAFDECCRQAEKIGVRVTGSELVGLIPKKAMLDAGKHYLRKQGRATGVPESELIETAVRSLGLNDLTPFDPNEKIIEYRIAPPVGELASMTLQAFADELSIESPAPGGGSVAALCGALSAALASMVAHLTYEKKGYEKFAAEMKDLPDPAQDLKHSFLVAIDKDTDAFNAVMDCFRMPKGTDEQKAERDKAIEDANKNATLIPLGVLKDAAPTLELAKAVALCGNKNSLSDAGVAGLTGRSAAMGAYYNVMINLQGISDEEFNEKVRKEAEEALEMALQTADEIETYVREKLGCSG